MKRALLVVGLLLGQGAPARAEGPELFGGYSYAHIEAASRHGGNAAFAFDLHSPLGLKIDASFHTGAASGTDASDLTLMAGPVFRLRRGGTVFFLHALAGLYRETASVSVFEVTISRSDSRFGFLGGGGIDIRIARRLALRVAGDYIRSQSEGSTLSGLRASAGVVFRAGGS